MDEYDFSGLPDEIPDSRRRQAATWILTAVGLTLGGFAVLLVAWLGIVGLLDIFGE